MTQAAWQPIDLSGDPYAAGGHSLDPADVYDAFLEMLELTKRPAWHTRAACRGQPFHVFFNPHHRNVKTALALCAECPVRAECLASAIEHGTTEGIWGGLKPIERRRLATAPSDAAAHLSAAEAADEEAAEASPASRGSRDSVSSAAEEPEAATDAGRSSGHVQDHEHEPSQ